LWNARAANGCTHLAAPCTSSLHVLSRPPARAASCDYFASRFIETIGKQVKCLYFTPGSHRYRICGFLTGLCLGYRVDLNRVDLRLLNLCDVKTRGYTFYYAVRIVQYAASVITRSSVRPSVRLSRRSTAAASAGGFAAMIGRGQQISIERCFCLVTRGPRTFWSDCKEVNILNHRIKENRLISDFGAKLRTFYD